MTNLYATDPLTLAERAELEQQYDGPITEGAIQDKIRARSAAPCGASESADSIRRDRAEHLDTAARFAAKVQSYRDLIGTWASQDYCHQEIDTYSRLFREAMDRADVCDRKLDALTIQQAAE